MAIVRWDPLGELTQLQDRINRAFSERMVAVQDQLVLMRV